MQLTSFVIFLLHVIVFARRPPSCPNDQQPKLDQLGNPIQCLPGTSSATSCGNNHICFFSGMNYMCCPSNEPSADNQNGCPSPSLAVLDSHGKPLKCDPLTRGCPQENMKCNNVGLEPVCCEQVKEITQTNKAAIGDAKEISQNKKPDIIGLPEETAECPRNSIGLINSDGTKVMCHAKTRCPGKNTFCYGAPKTSVCCERYDFATNILDQADVISLDSVDSSAEIRSETQSVPLKSTRRYQSSTRHIIESRAKVDVEKRNKERTKSISSAQLADIEKIGNAISAEAIISANSSTSFANTSMASKSEETTTSTRPILSTSVEIEHTQTKQEPSVLSSPTLPSQLFSKQDKRSMAQQFLMHQIRNGWPYADRFYRPDLDAFSPQQRRDMAQIYFSDQ